LTQRVEEFGLAPLIAR